MIDLGLTGARVLVSGAGYIPTRAGHGRATARLLADAGAAVACVDIDADRAKAVVAEIQEAGGAAHPVVADMTDPAQVRRAVAESTRLLGGLDVCVDIIGGARWEPAETAPATDLDWVLRNNLTQVFTVFQEAARYLIEQGSGGSLIALSSVDGTTAAAYHASYGAAKAGVISLAKSFAHEWGRHGIRVNTVAPGNVGTGNEDLPEDEYGAGPVNPLAPPRAHDIADAVLFLASRLSSRITGQTIVVDGGASIRELWGITPRMLPSMREGSVYVQGGPG